MSKLFLRFVVRVLSVETAVGPVLIILSCDWFVRDKSYDVIQGVEINKATASQQSNLVLRRWQALLCPRACAKNY